MHAVIHFCTYKLFLNFSFPEGSLPAVQRFLLLVDKSYTKSYTRIFPCFGHLRFNLKTAKMSFLFGPVQYLLSRGDKIHTMDTGIACAISFLTLAPHPNWFSCQPHSSVVTLVLPLPAELSATCLAGDIALLAV